MITLPSYLIIAQLLIIAVIVFGVRMAFDMVSDWVDAFSPPVNTQAYDDWY